MIEILIHSRLSKRVMRSLKRMKEQYELRVKHAEKQPKEFEFDISVDLEPSYVIIPTDKVNKYGINLFLHMLVIMKR